jgi:hypothetical protein
MSTALWKNLVAFAASPARHFPAACSKSSAASKKSFSDCGSGAFSFPFGFGLRKSFLLGGIFKDGDDVAQTAKLGQGARGDNLLKS